MSEKTVIAKAQGSILRVIKNNNVANGYTDLYHVRR